MVGGKSMHLRYDREKKMSLSFYRDRFVGLEPGCRARSYLKASIVSVQLETRSSAKKVGDGS